MESQSHPTQRSLEPVFLLLKWTFVLLPVAAGLDKFSNLLTYWPKYLSPMVTDILPFSAITFMKIVGVIEIVAGIIVLAKPRVGAHIVAAWLLLIALNLLAGMEYTDVAVRDIVMAIAAFSTAKMAKVFS